MRKTLGVNISHNCSFAYFENNILKEYYEEDRFNKIKNYMPDDNEDGNYTYEYKVLQKFKNITFDVVAVSSYDRGHLQIELPIINHILKQLKYKKYYFNINNHHIYHVTCGYYFSKFKKALAVITDGGGEIYNKWFKVMQSIFYIDDKNIKTYYKHFTNNKIDYFLNFNEIPSEEHIKINDHDSTVSNKLIGGYKYLKYTMEAGFKPFEEGQLMGLAAYKNPIAIKAQEECLQENIELIKKAITYNDCKNIILSGGYHLNCSNNFKLVKHFPDLNFFVDPIAHDGGTAVGVAYYENYIK